MLKASFSSAVRLAIALGACGAFAVPMAAQTTQDVSVSLTVPTLLTLTVNSNAFTFAAPSASDFAAGQLDASSATTFTVKANTAWKVAVSPVGANMGTVGSYTKPLSDFLWQTSGAYTAINAATPPNAASGTSGTSGSATGVNYRVLLSYANDVPGTYNAMSVRYTLTTN